MEQTRMGVFFLALALLSQVDARGVVKEKAKAASLVADPKISPPLRDVKSDKKFFGPPFPADYVEDTRPIPDSHVMDKLKGPDQPYPALQSKDKFDRDYVKDENSDKGAWKAQFEYDYLRKKMAREAAEERAAEGRAGKEGHDLDDAQKRSDDAGRNADDARKGVDDAKREEGEATQPEDFDDMPEGTIKEKKAKLEKLKTAVKAAEENLEKEKKEFEQCQKNLDDAKKNLDELKAKEKEMSAQLAAETKLWLETKTVRMQAKKAKKDAETSKRNAKRVEALEKLNAAKAVKADTDKILAEKKSLAAKAQENLRKEKAQLEKFQADMAKATVTLQKLRGYTPAKTEVKSAASMTSVLLTFSMLLAMSLF